MQLQMTSANQITILRMAMIPLFLVLIVYRYFTWGFVVFVVAGISDALDGLIARRFGQKTALGAFLDPLADKLLLSSAFVILSFDTLGLFVRIPLWFTIAAISRDVVIVLTVLAVNLTGGRRVFPPTILGKLTTFVQLVVVLAALVGNVVQYAPPYYEPLLAAALGVTVASAIHYLVRTMKTLNQSNEA
jgi:cardiolipin synthase